MDYNCFWNHYKLIASDLSNQIELKSPDLKQQINVNGRLGKYNAVMLFIIEKLEEKFFDFSQNAATVVWFGLVMDSL